MIFRSYMFLLLLFSLFICFVWPLRQPMMQPYRTSRHRSNPEAMEERLPLNGALLKNTTAVGSESESSLPLSSSTSLIGHLDRLKFGYEDGRNVQRTIMRRRFVNTNRIFKSDNRVAAIAVCDSSRISGCEPLLRESGITRYNSSAALTELPCVTDGMCPFIKFRCSRGHEWKAAPGSPVCMHCPICDSKRISGKKRDSDFAKSKIRKELKIYISSRGGQLISKPMEVTSHNTHVKIRCRHLHEWECSVGNLLLLNTWCAACHADSMRLSIEELERTAQHFNGTFLGKATVYSPDDVNWGGNIRVGGDETKCKYEYSWKCSLGHEFRMHPNNIRRKTGGKRKCSWCPQCKKELGIQFIWNP